MFTLQAGYQVRDYDEWVELFDRDRIGRAASGVRSYRVFRDVEDGNYVVVHLDFDTKDEAAAFLERPCDLVWNNPDVMPPLLAGPPAVRILEEVVAEVLDAG
jgi:quinol monooxygenase YgiN